MTNDYKKILWGLVATLIVLLVLFPTLQNEWTSWDDQAYILDNPLVKQLNWKSIKAIFGTLSFNGGYTPIPILSWALNYTVSGPKAFSFHLTNLLLHLLNVLLCYSFVRKLTTNMFVAFVVALLFGMHPMNLEPVAWITGRKDLLLGLFSLGTLLTWTHFLESDSKSWKWYFISIVLFMLALLSKGTAVVIPVWMVLMACYKRGTLVLPRLYMGLPFVALGLLFGLLAIWSQQNSTALNEFSKIDFSDSLIWSMQALGTYLVKLGVPYLVGPYHPYPPRHSILLSLVGLGAICLVFVASYRLAKQSANTVAFGYLFLLVGLLPILQFLPVGFALTADRYAYLPFIGGYLIIVQIINSQRFVKVLRTGVIIVLVCLFGYQTRMHAAVWYSDESLWNHVISNHAHAPRAYVNRGQYFLNAGAYEKAQEDLQKAISQQPDLKEAHQQLGLVFQAQRKFDKASHSFNAALAIDCTYVPALLNLGLNDVYMGNLVLAFANLKRAESIEPQHQLVLLNLGFLYERNGELTSAHNKYSQVVRSYPFSSTGYRYRGVLRFKQGDYKGALQDFEDWRELDGRDAMVYRWIARASAQLGVQKRFYESAVRASELSGPLSPEEFDRLENLIR